jgi:hypothetical protein
VASRTTSTILFLKHRSKDNTPNTLLEYIEEDHCIQFLSDGGHQFSVPIVGDVQVIHVLTEGIVIGWGSEGEYSYCTLATYPMESIHPLGVLRGERISSAYNEYILIDVWLKSNE